MQHLRPPPGPATPWDDQLAPLLAGAGSATWRLVCDRLHQELCDRWLAPDPGATVYKTDLFDEAVGAGLAATVGARAGAVVGTDVAAGVAAAAVANHPGLLAVRADVRQLPFAGGSFDAVVSNSTLDHFADPGDIAVALHELHRVTRPGGTLIVTLDNPRHPLVAARSVVPDRVLAAAGLRPYFVGATLSLNRLAAAVDTAGFTVDDTATLMHTVRVAAMAACARADRASDPAARQRLIDRLVGRERLGRLPTRQFTAHFIAVRATRR
jgi:SAM-dependent methyltransferase